MNDTDKMKRVCDRLRLIERTRLLKNTSKELEQLVGFSIGSGNGLARKGGRSLFVQDAIFRELAHIVSEQTGLDLEEVLEAYIATDRICERLGKVTDPETLCRNLIWHFYGDDEPTDDIAPILNRVEIRQLPILILLLLKALPRPSAKGGDVCDIAADYSKVLTFLSETVNKNILMQKLPLLTQLEDELRREPTQMCRIHLIYITNQILNSYGALSTRERICFSNKELADSQIEPMFEGIWVEDEPATLFWRLESIANGYHLYRYEWDSSAGVLHFTKYFMKFYQLESGIMALAISPAAIRYLISDKPMPNNMFAYLDCEIKGEGREQSIKFSPQSVDAQWFRLSGLHRSAQEDFFCRLLEDERYELIDNYADDAYDFTLSLVAITRDHIYLSKDETHYYKVPKSLHSLLDEVSFSSNVGVLAFRNATCNEPSTYIAFDDFNLYYDVSTPEMMDRHQIELSDCISE